MGSRKTCNSYYFSVEGETEQWYLEHLQGLINNSDEAAYSVRFITKVKKDPREMVKVLSVPNKVTVNHLCDIESNEKEHIKNFLSTLDNMEEACSMGKMLSYKLGYSNFAFDLWIVLHKTECNTQLFDRSRYLKYINSCFDTSFNSMDKYKKERNFKRCLDKITLENVISAINRARKIMDNNITKGYEVIQYKKYTYYKENPSLSIHEIIANILKQCKLIS